ncbi:MAG: hypothetical protein Q6366_000905 [Candidatus Freyarchaeota archaeon]
MEALGDKRAVEPLTQALKDEDKFIRELAEWALQRIAQKNPRKKG